MVHGNFRIQYSTTKLVLSGFRGDQIWAKPYLDRSSMEPSEHLKELVEYEIDKMDRLRKAKVRNLKKNNNFDSVVLRKYIINFFIYSSKSC